MNMQNKGRATYEEEPQGTNSQALSATLIIEGVTALLQEAAQVGVIEPTQATQVGRSIALAATGLAIKSSLNEYSGRPLSAGTLMWAQATAGALEGPSGKSQSTAEQVDILEKVRSLISSGQATLDPDQASPQVALIGQVATADGQDVMLLNHTEIAKVLDFEGGPRALSNALKRYAIPDSEGNTTRRGRIGSANTRCVAIPMSVWEQGGERW